MADAERLRAEAARLLARAMDAHDKGDAELAQMFTQLATHYLDEAIDHATDGTSPHPPAEALHVVQQQQQAQPKKREHEE
jgi:hypothetical protein